MTLPNCEKLILADFDGGERASASQHAACGGSGPSDQMLVQVKKADDGSFRLVVPNEWAG